MCMGFQRERQEYQSINCMWTQTRMQQRRLASSVQKNEEGQGTLLLHCEYVTKSHRKKVFVLTVKEYTSTTWSTRQPPWDTPLWPLPWPGMWVVVSTSSTHNRKHSSTRTSLLWRTATQDQSSSLHWKKRWRREMRITSNWMTRPHTLWLIWSVFTQNRRGWCAITLHPQAPTLCIYGEQYTDAPFSKTQRMADSA